MTTKISFSQYLDSKKQLLESIKRDPIITTSYTVVKYCKLPIASNDDANEKQYIELKPKHIIEVVWHYKNDLKDIDINEMQRQPLKIKLIDQCVEFALQLKEQKLTKWLQTNTRED